MHSLKDKSTYHAIAPVLTVHTKIISIQDSALFKVRQKQDEGYSYITS